jgi:4-amino-4-deoxy-L-arabinose transferase-like glycosyltransferase
VPRVTPWRTALRRPAVVLAVLLGVHALAWWLQPFAFLDDLDSPHYARIAAEMQAGKFTLEPHTFHYRFGVTLPTAAVYGALGVGPRTTTVWPLVASLLTIVGVFAIAERSFGRNAALLAALLLATNPVQVEYAAHLLPDIVVSGFMLASVALLDAAREPDRAAGVPGGGRPWLFGSLCVLSLLAAALTKETAVWAALFFLGVLVLDLARRRNLRLWTAIVASGAVALGLFLLAYAVATGDPLHILEVMERTHNASVQASFVGKSSDQYFDRLTLATVRFLVEQLGYGHLALLAIPALVHLVRPLRRMSSGARFWAAYTVVLLLCFWFGSTSLRSYNPLPISARFLMPLVAPLSLLGGVVLAGVVSEDERERGSRVALLVAAAAFGAAGVALASSRPARAAMYGGVGLALGFLATPAAGMLRGLPARAARLAVVAGLSLGILVYCGLKGGVRQPNPLRVLEREFVAEHIATLPDAPLVLTDNHSAFVLPMLLRRDGASGVRIVDWNDAAAVQAHAGERAYVFVDQTTLGMLAEWLGRPIHGFALAPPPHWRRLAGVETKWRGGFDPFDGQEILLFEIDDPAELSPP